MLTKLWSWSRVKLGAATSMCTRVQKRRGSTRIRGVQPGDVQNRAVQQMAGDWVMSLRGELPIRSWNQGITSGDQASTLQNWGLPHGAYWRHLPIWSPLPLPPLSHRTGAAHGSGIATVIDDSSAMNSRVMAVFLYNFDTNIWLWLAMNSTYTIRMKGNWIYWYCWDVLMYNCR